jgi:hypothetical protein
MSGFGQLAGAGIQAYGAYKAAGLTAAAASSKRLKEYIEPIKYALEKLEAIRGVEFDWKEIAFNRTRGYKGHDVGVIAEELEVIMPEAVPTVDGYKHVEYHKIIPLLIEAIKEQQEQINKLQER